MEFTSVSFSREVSGVCSLTGFSDLSHVSLGRSAVAKLFNVIYLKA